MGKEMIELSDEHTCNTIVGVVILVGENVPKVIGRSST